MRIFKLYIILFLFFISCEEEISWDVKPEQTHDIVVEGIITNERIQQTIKLTQPVYSLNQEIAPIINAQVNIGDGENIFHLSELEDEPGVYKTDNIFQGVIMKPYHLQIEYNGKTYSGYDEMIPVTPIQPLMLDNNPEDNRLFAIHIEDSTIPSMLEIYIDWTMLPGYDSISAENKKAKILFYKLNTIDISEIFKPDKETIYFPAGTQIIRKKYSLSDIHQEYIRSMLSETEWRGGYFDILPGNVKTNMSEGALGFFGACTVVTDTLYASDMYVN